MFNYIFDRKKSYSTRVNTQMLQLLYEKIFEKSFTTYYSSNYHLLVYSL